MNINNMTREEFKQLKVLEQGITDFDCIVLLPTKLKHDSGYNYYSIIPCLRDEPLGKLPLYDTFMIMDDFEGGFDCLRKSCLMRVFFQRGKYFINPLMHFMKTNRGKR